LSFILIATTFILDLLKVKQSQLWMPILLITSAIFGLVVDSNLAEYIYSPLVEQILNTKAQVSTGVLTIVAAVLYLINFYLKNNNGLYKIIPFLLFLHISDFVSAGILWVMTAFILEYFKSHKHRSLTYGLLVTPIFLRVFVMSNENLVVYDNLFNIFNLLLCIHVVFMSIRTASIAYLAFIIPILTFYNLHILNIVFASIILFSVFIYSFEEVRNEIINFVRKYLDRIAVWSKSDHKTKLNFTYFKFGPGKSLNWQSNIVTANIIFIWVILFFVIFSWELKQ
jgi:hypothetical protein